MSTQNRSQRVMSFVRWAEAMGLIDAPGGAEWSRRGWSFAEVEAAIAEADQRAANDDPDEYFPDPPPEAQAEKTDDRLSGLIGATLGEISRLQSERPDLYGDDETEMKVAFNRMILDGLRNHCLDVERSAAGIEYPIPEEN